MSRLFRMQWDGDAFVPLKHMKRFADEDLVVGKIYDVEANLPRSMASHNHFFARIEELWNNLPEGMELEYPSPEHLRKRMLIECGWHDKRDFVCASEDSALQLATFLHSLDEYSVIVVRGQVVRMWTAKSQKMSKQDRKEFQQTKTAVLDKIEKLIGIEPQAINQ